MEYTVSLRKLNEVHFHQYSAIYLCTPNFSLYYPSHRYLSQVLYGNTDSTCASSPCCKKLYNFGFQKRKPCSPIIYAIYIYRTFFL